jgi:hypothetical protein
LPGTLARQEAVARTRVVVIARICASTVPAPGLHEAFRVDRFR